MSSRFAPAALLIVNHFGDDIRHNHTQNGQANQHRDQRKAYQCTLMTATWQPKSRLTFCFSHVDGFRQSAALQASQKRISAHAPNG